MQHIHFSRDRVSFSSMLIHYSLVLPSSRSHFPQSLLQPCHFMLHRDYCGRSSLLRRSIWRNSPVAQLSPLIPDKSDDHAVEVEEEHKQVEAKLDERLLLVHVKLPEDLRGVKQVLVLEDPVRRSVSACSMVPCNSSRCTLRQRGSRRSGNTYFLAFHARRGRLRMSGTQ
jgi:hypothetical protein